MWGLFIGASMKIFAKNAITFSDGQPNLMALPTDIVNNGFRPATPTEPGSPLVAQWFNSVFRDITRNLGYAGQGTKAPSPKARAGGDCVYQLIISYNGVIRTFAGATPSADVNAQETFGSKKLTITGGNSGDFTFSDSVIWCIQPTVMGDY